ncbi:hypothetical protein HDE_00747 [Halotydeus destructor]|nr:hypothetical protein HDE_00747 [Halotydeus destructor]
MDHNKMLEKKLETADVGRNEIKMLVDEKEREHKLEEAQRRAEFDALLADKSGHVEEYEEQEVHHVEVRKRPQKEDTGTNPVAVFMLFYGSVTLCLGIVALFREIPVLIAGLIGVSILGIVILVSAGFSVLMLLSVTKDCIIVVLSYKYREMILASEVPAAKYTDPAAAATASQPF